MKLLGGAVVMFIVLVAACAPAPQEVVIEEGPSVEADRESIRGVVNAHWDARMAEDLEAEMDTWADDAQLHRNSLTVLSGKEAIRAFAADEVEQYDWEWEFTSEEVDATGDLGFHLGTFTLTQTDQSGEARTYYGSTMLILRRQSDGAWKISRYMWNNRPPAEQ